jgi:bifunctional non-homologous end joining protein LigD
VRLALIRTEGEGEKSSWLLHRMKTDAAGRPQPDGIVVEPSPQADERPPVPRDAPAETPAPAAPSMPELRPMLATNATPGIARQAAARWGADAWVEGKWDGIRAIGVWDGSRLRLFARSGNDITHRYPELTDLDAGLGDTPAVVDGELVALEPDGRPSFPLLQSRMNLERPAEIAREARRTPVRYYLFDVLAADGVDVADQPLRARRRVLEHLASEAIALISVPPVFDDVDAALEASRALRLEGIVVKDPRSRYARGSRSESWLKVKHTATQEVVIAGIRPGKGGRSGTFGSLLLGIPGPDGLRYAGRVGSGFSDSMLAQLLRTLTPLRTDDNPLVGVPPLDAREALWVRPELVGEVEYGEFTPAGILRHPRWRGLRPEKTPDEVRRED